MQWFAYESRIVFLSLHHLLSFNRNIRENILGLDDKLYKKILKLHDSTPYEHFQNNDLGLIWNNMKTFLIFINSPLDSAPTL